MTISIIPCSSEQDRGIWQDLQEAIANTSGFERWQEETNLQFEEEVSLEDQVRGYLRSTLETLAY